jgi:HK97 family phage prohead protease
MKKMEKDPKRKDREFRQFEFEVRTANADGSETQELYAEGYAVTFNSPTVLYEWDGVQYKEVIDGRAFEGADMTDVIFNYNHGGKVMARTRNQTLQLTVDTRGVFVRARLDGTEEGRKLYEEIRGGYIDRMSFQFSTKEDSYDRETKTRTIRSVKKLYDVSAVDIPAYDTTTISARSFFEAEAEKERQAAVNATEQRQRLILLTLI